MPYRTNSRTRQKKDAKRTAMMQAAMRVFAEKGYHAATIRDIVGAAEVAIGTFYFYFPDKETLFVHLYEETAEFLLQAISQAVRGRGSLPEKIREGLQAYVNIAVYEPAVVQLLLEGGLGAVTSLHNQRATYREKMINIWYRLLDDAMRDDQVADQNPRRSAEALAGAMDEVILSLLAHPNPEMEAAAAIGDMIQFSLRAIGYQPGH